MRTKLLEKSVEVLLEKAEDCLDLARLQRKSADKQQEGANEQHLSACKLEELGQALVHDAFEIKDELKKDGAPTKSGSAIPIEARPPGKFADLSPLSALRPHHLLNGGGHSL